MLAGSNRVAETGRSRAVDLSQVRGLSDAGRVGCDRVSGVIASWTGLTELGRELRTLRIRDGSSEFLDELRTCLGF